MWFERARLTQSTRGSESRKMSSAIEPLSRRLLGEALHGAEADAL